MHSIRPYLMGPRDWFKRVDTDVLFSKVHDWKSACSWQVFDMPMVAVHAAFCMVDLLCFLRMVQSW